MWQITMNHALATLDRDRHAERHCAYCHKLYRGAAPYCSVECERLDVASRAIVEGA
jgi:hypothetical protein